MSLTGATGGMTTFWMGAWSVQRTAARAADAGAQNNQLCLLLPEVSKVSPVCFDVVLVGGELQYRDAGSVVYAGTVRKNMAPPAR